jgi:hypothetical protein
MGGCTKPLSRHTHSSGWGQGDEERQVVMPSTKHLSHRQFVAGYTSPVVSSLPTTYPQAIIAVRRSAGRGQVEYC